MRKVISDALIIARIELYPLQRDWLSYLIFALFLPMSMMFFASRLAPPDAPLLPRLVAGAMVFSFGISVVNSLAQTLVQERFNKQLQLLVVSPVNRVSYAMGALGVGALIGVVSSAVILGMAPLFGFDISLSVWIAPIALLTAASMVGVSLLIGTWAPTQQTGGMMANFVGILISLLSPIYFSIERLPEWLQWVARLSPYTHAAQAFDEALQGSLPGLEIAILAAISAVTLTVGIKAMRWRDI